MRSIMFPFLASLGLMLASSRTASALDAASTCEAGKLKVAGKYGFCRLNADAKGVGKGAAADYSVCGPTYAAMWASIESKSGGACPTSGDKANIDAVVSDHQADVLRALTPGGSPVTAGGKKCAATKLKAAGKYGFCRLNAESKAVRKGASADYSKCGPKLNSSFAKAELKGGGECPTSGDAAGLSATATAHADNVALLLSEIGATSCPVAFKLTTRAGYGASTSNVTRVESGTNGYADVQDLPARTSMTLAVASCANATPPCGDCTLQGADASHLGRCSNNVTTSCNAINAPDSDDCAGATCDYFLWGAPRHVVAGGSTFCVVQRLTSDITGSINNETGGSVLNIASRTHIYFGITNLHPCPVCAGDTMADDGVRAGICQGGDRNGAACDANGGDATFGASSLDCPPPAGYNLTGAGLLRTTLLSTAGDSHPFGVPCDPPLAGYACPCAVCTGDFTVPCSSNGDCAALAVGTCTAPGGGEQRTPNRCDDLNCVAAGGGIGQCTAGLPEKLCDGVLRANGEPLLYCASNDDCALFSAGTCTLSKQHHPCFLDPIVAIGTASPSAPTLAGVDCHPPSSNAAINGIFGLPGPERSTVKFDLGRIY